MSGGEWLRDRLAGWEIEFTQPAVKRGAAHSQEARGLRSVATGLSEGGHETTALVSGDNHCGRRVHRPLTKFGRKICGFEHVALAMNHCALDRALEFPHIAGPMLLHQGRHRRWAGAMDDFPHAGPPLGEEGGDEEGNIFLSLPQRRKLDS